MRYFRSGNAEWRMNEQGQIHSREWEETQYNSLPHLQKHFSGVIETDAAGNPLGKYRYFRDTGHPKCEWRHSESAPSWEIRNFAIRGDWISSSFYTPSGFLSGKGAYECDEQGGRLAAKEEDNKPLNWKPIRPESSPAPVSEEDRFRWQFAGQAMAGFRLTTDAHFAADASVAAADALIAALKKPKVEGASNG